MNSLNREFKKESGFTLVEVIIAMLILSIVISAALMAFVYSIQISRDNQYTLNATNLANDRIEEIRSMGFADVGTKFVSGGITIDGDPSGEILQSEIKSVDNVNYLINTTIAWEDESGWELSSTDWDYKSVRVEVIPQIPGKEDKLTKVVNTYVTREFFQPILKGANIAIRAIRGWKLNPTDVVPVANVKVNLTGPDTARQIKTSASGIGRFVDLKSGAYTVDLAASTAGVMFHPDVTSTWLVNLTTGTQAKQFEVESPVYLRVCLKSLEGTPISLNSSETGDVQMVTPYGPDINVSFNGSNISSDGYLPQSLFGGLWPVGAGYSGAYTISSVTMENSTFFGAYEAIGGTESLWSGTFDAPGTTKNIICYFGVFPKTPSSIGDNWADASASLKLDVNPFVTDIAVFSSPNPEDTLIMPASESSDYNAKELYFENTGSAVQDGLMINNYARINLHSGKIVFRGSIRVASDVPAEQGKILLRNVYSDGTNAPQIPGASIGGTANVGSMYGKVYFMKPMIVGGLEIVSPGAYYFYDGLVLPDNASELIPITKENFVN